MDKAGEIIGGGQPLAANQSVSDAVIRFELARFITDARSVLSDGAAEKAALHRVYDMARGEAATVLPTWSRNHPPFEIASKETLQSEGHSFLRAPTDAS